MEHNMLANLPILEDADLDLYLEKIDTQKILEETFAALYAGLVVQPPQSLTLFPENRGDFITYLGVLSHFDVFGGKLSPYITTGAAPIITAWTILMSMKTGRPLLLCDSGRLTAERTAAGTALAIKKLAPAKAQVLALIGSGSLARAHLKHALKLRDWSEIRVFSPSLKNSPEKQAGFKQIAGQASFSASAQECVRKADVIMLATSSGTPVINVADIGKNALITSISTNVPKAHEIDPAFLPAMDVYCDYKKTTPDSAGEMLLAAESGLWSKEQIKGDLAELCANKAPLPSYDKMVFFRSIGLGLEDVAVAYALYKEYSSRL